MHDLWGKGGASLQLDQLVYGRRRQGLNQPLELKPRGGETWAVLGENGVGKSTLLATLAGLLPPVTGRVCVGGVPLHRHPRKLLARRLGLLLQQDYVAFPFSVREAVSAGRYAHRHPWQRLGARDQVLLDETLALTGLTELAERRLDSLSGGELRRVAIATLFLQQPDVLLLDEPFNHLDVRHQTRVLDELGRRANEGRLVILALHDVNLAVRCASHMLLLYPDGGWDAGPAGQVLCTGHLERLYNVPMHAVQGQGETLWVPGRPAP